MTQSVKRPTFGFGSGHGRMGGETQPCVWEATLSRGSARRFSPPAPSPTHACLLALTLSNQSINLKKEKVDEASSNLLCWARTVRAWWLNTYRTPWAGLGPVRRG